MSLFTYFSSIFAACLHLFRYLLLPNSTTVISDLYEASANATTYEEWREYQEEIDLVNGQNDWRTNDESRDYDWKDLRHKSYAIQRFQVNGDILSLCGLLRSHPVRNICRILSPSLYARARAGTKTSIEEYVSLLCNAIKTLAAIGNNEAPFPKHDFTPQSKRELFDDTRQAYGHSTLVLQGGSAFSMYHLGVAKALHLRDLLPNIITGTATGALIAALVGTTSKEDLPKMLTGDTIDLSAFSRAQLRKQSQREVADADSKFLPTLQRRVARFLQTGHFFDIKVLQDCAQDNFKDFTFEDAYAVSGRVLNITVAWPEEADMPQLLNYVTAPNVLIWSAVVASIATSKTMYAPVQLQAKDQNGVVTLFSACDAPRTPQHGKGHRKEAPLRRISELFNVNHFIISQARPYMVPIVRIRRWNPDSLLGFFARYLLSEAGHWLQVADDLGLLPVLIVRMLMDEVVPSTAHWAKICLTPRLSLWDLLHLFDVPTRTSLASWITRGERSVWPNVTELQVRCGVEFELDAAYESVRGKTTGLNNRRAIADVRSTAFM